MHGRRGITWGPWKLVSGCKSQMLHPLANCFDLCRGLSCLEQTGSYMFIRLVSLKPCWNQRVYRKMAGACVCSYFCSEISQVCDWTFSLVNWKTCNPTVISQLALHWRMKWLWLLDASLPQEGLSIVHLEFGIFELFIQIFVPQGGRQDGMIRLIRTVLASNMAQAICHLAMGFETFKTLKTQLDVSEFSKKLCAHGVGFWLHPWRLTWNIIMEVWKIIFLSKWMICRFHVNIPGRSY